MNDRGLAESTTTDFSLRYVLFLPALLAASVFLVSCSAPRANDRLEAVLWYQHAAEARALYYQAYNVACDRLKGFTEQPGNTNKLAVIMDVDETVLNNSPFEAGLVQRHQDFTPVTWDDWTKERRAERLPGAVDFLQFAASRGVDVFYITDRATNEYEATAQNLKAQGFPMVDEQHLWLTEPHSGKEPKRQKVRAQGYTVIMLFGDSLPDFSSQFNQTDSLDRVAAVDQAREEFGREYIVLPNPMYGAWDRVLASDAKKAGLVKRSDYLRLPLPPVPPLGR